MQLARCSGGGGGGDTARHATPRHARRPGLPLPPPRAATPAAAGHPSMRPRPRALVSQAAGCPLRSPGAGPRGVTGDAEPSVTRAL